jgi:hypothetical protein
MTNGRTWTCVGLALVLACVLAAPTAAEDKTDLQQFSKAALAEAVKNPSMFLRGVNVSLPPPETRPLDPKQYGGNVALMMIPAQSFHAYASGFTYQPGADIFYKEAAGDNGLFLEAPLELQPGTEVGIVCTFWHDTDTTADGGSDGLGILFGQELGDSNGPPSLQIFAATGVDDTAADGYVSSCVAPDPAAFTVRGIADLSDPDAVARAVTYFFWVFVDFSSQQDISFGGAAIFFRRLITPTPATDTFDDVPVGDAAGQHRYVEALAAAGITSGCQTSPPLYCPNAPLTRGQMAVFLSRIVGLWWPF